MQVSMKLSTLHESRWYEYAIRFVLGGTATVVAGVVATKYGPVVGGLFLAFPAIFPASATLVEKHERERKERAGLRGTRRGKDAAALESAGASLGSVGLMAFGAVIWLMSPVATWLVFLFACAAWVFVSPILWSNRRTIRGRPGIGSGNGVLGR